MWRGTDIALGRPVAVKQMRREAARDAAARARFRSEAQHVGALNHAGIARIYDYDEPASAEPPFLVMEFVDGPSLAEVVAGGPLDPARVMDIVAQVAAALQAAHQIGLVHRDIKPGNIVLGRDGLVKLTDFGISAVTRSPPVSAAGTLLGTPGYLAPERASGGSATVASDLYALGVVAHQCLAGRLPFDGTPEEAAQPHRRRAVRPPDGTPEEAPQAHRRTMRPLPATVPAEVVALVSELTAKDPAGRPSSAGEVARCAAALHDRLTAAGADSAGPQAPISRDWLPAAGFQTAEAVTRPLRWTRPRRQNHYAPLTLAAAGVALIALVVADVLKPARPHVAAAPPRPSLVMVQVDAARLHGRPADAVRGQLQRLGLRVMLKWRASSQARPGQVLAVQPSGFVIQGTLVVVTVALRPPATSFWDSQPVSAPALPRHRHRPRPPASPTISPSPSQIPSPSPTGTPTPTGSPTPTGTPTPTSTGSRSPKRVDSRQSTPARLAGPDSA